MTCARRGYTTPCHPSKRRLRAHFLRKTATNHNETHGNDTGLPPQRKRITMPRKRIELGPAAEDMIRVLLSKGGTVESITAALRAGPAPLASPATVGRRMAEVRQSVNEGRSERRQATAGVVESDLPGSAEEIPAGSSLADYDRWIAKAERMADDADAEGDLKAMGYFARLVGFFMAERRKAAPEPVPDPNDHPDMVALGAEVEQRLLKMVDLVLEEM